MIEYTNVLPEYGTLGEVKRFFGVPPETSRQLIARKQVRAIKMYHRILVEFDSMRTYLGSLPVATDDEVAYDIRSSQPIDTAA